MRGLAKPAAADDATRAHANRVGILPMVAAMACFIINDTLVKYVSQTAPAAELIFIRSAMASLMVLTVVVATSAKTQLREIGRGWVLVRAGLDAIATFLYLVSLFHLPIATATSIYSTLPLLITMLAALVIGERVRAALWVATAVGFAGVLLIVQPRSTGLDFYAGVCFAATAIVALRDIVTRRVHHSVPSIVVTLSTTLMVTVLAGVLSLVEGWRTIAVRDLGMLAIAATSLACAYVLIVRSTRRGDLSVVAPFRYSALVFAVIVGFVVWGDVPNALAWCGIALLVGSGIYVLRTSRMASTASPSLE
ncbi:MAG TPA: DMT family transporter [Casimicrobiaceae bacterium]|nr:DMT family transporter [Casimicrobiaceae bacterium]